MLPWTRSGRSDFSIIVPYMGTVQGAGPRPDFDSLIVNWTFLTFITVLLFYMTSI